jgi:hypothetical protein
MIKKSGWICGLTLGIGLAIGASAPASAAKPVAIEKELLGVRVLQSYREVLLRYGAPTRVFRATETVNYQEATSLGGAPTGGVMGILDSSSGSGGPGGGMMGGPGGGMVAPPGGGLIAPPGGKGGGSGSPGMSGYPGMGGGAPGGGQAGGDNPDASYSEAGGFTWVYLYPGKELAYEFHFNKDGRVERIAELGRGFGQHTSRGIGLGDTIEKVYSVYGWTDSIKEEVTGKFSLLYNDRYHAQFLILKNRVVGISVFLKENQYLRFEGGSGGGGGAGGPAGMSGGPMMGGGSSAGRGMVPGGKRGGKMGGGGA